MVLTAVLETRVFHRTQMPERGEGHSLPHGFLTESCGGLSSAFEDRLNGALPRSATH